MADRIIKQPVVQEVTGYSRTTIWRRIKDGEFPPPRLLGGGRIGWLESEVQEFIRTRPVAAGGESGDGE